MNNTTYATATSAGAGIGAVLILILLLALYFGPVLVAAFRKHRQTLAIFMVNLFLGWTFIGWIVALVWACTNNQPAVVIENNAGLGPALSGPKTTADEIDQFAKLRSSGVISEEEFQAKKRQLLGLPATDPAPTASAEFPEQLG